MVDDAMRAVGALLDMGPEPEEEGEPTAEEGLVEDPETEGARMALDAVKADDPAALVTALRSLMQLMQAAPPSLPSEE